MGNKCCGANTTPSTGDIAKGKGKKLKKKGIKKNASDIVSSKPIKMTEKHYIATNELFTNGSGDPDA